MDHNLCDMLLLWLYGIDVVAIQTLIGVDIIINNRIKYITLVR